MSRLLVTLFLLIQFQLFSQEIIISKGEITTVSEILNQFEKVGIAFSYDASAIEKTYIQITPQKLSLEMFLSLLNNQVAIAYKKSDTNTYTLIKKDVTVNFCAFIKDTATNYEVEGVQILSDGTLLGISDSSGTISLDISPGSKLQLKYNDQFIDQVFVASNDTGCPTFLIDSVITILDEIVIQDYLTKGMVQNKNGSIQLIPSDLGILPGAVEPDIFQSLQLVPGISSPNEDPALLHIRGGTPDQNLVLWDGIKMYLNGHFFNQISAFNPYITKEVQIYRGGTSVQYGDRISGVIDIKSADDLFDNEFGGGFNLTSFDFYAKTPITDKIGVLVSARRSINDFLETFTFNSLSEKAFGNIQIDPTTGEEIILSKNEFRSTFSDFNVKGIWKFTPYKKLTLSAIYIQDETYNENFQNTQVQSPLTRDADEEVFQSNFGASITYTDKTPKNHFKTFQAYVSNYSSEYDLFNSLSNENVFQNNLFLQRSDYIFDAGYDASINIQFNDNKSLLIGQQTSYKEIFNEIDEGTVITFDPNEEITFDALPSILDAIGYGQYTYHNSKIKTITGVRAGYYNNFETPFIEARAFGSFKFLNSFQITASIEQKNQSISQYYAPQQEPELFALVPLINSYWSEQRFDNNSVRLLKSSQATIGSVINHKGWTFEIEGYYKDIQGLTPFTNGILTQALVVLEREGVPKGSSIRYGVDFLAKKKTGNHRIWLSYSFGNNKLTFPDIQSKSFLDPFNQKHRINISQTYQYRNLELGMGWTFSTGLPTTQFLDGSKLAIQNALNTNSLSKEQLPNYHRLDFSIFNTFKKTKNWKGKLGFAIRNIYARSKPLQPFYTLTRDNSETFVNTNTTNTLGLTADIVFRVTWN